MKLSIVFTLLLVIWSSHAAAPPTVSIVNPTNNGMYFSSDNLAIVAEAFALDAAITNVQILLGTKVIGNFISSPCFVLTNLWPSTNAQAFSAIAVDNQGSRATSAVVLATVKSKAEVAAVGPTTLDRDTGLFIQYVRISNTTTQSFPNGLRLFVGNVNNSTNDALVWNATGTNALAVPFIDLPAPFPVGATTNVPIQLYVPGARQAPSPVYFSAPLPLDAAPPPRPALAAPDRMGANLLMQFTAATNRLYYLQSSSNLFQWTTLPGLIIGNGEGVQRTNPVATTEFFRVLMFP